MLVKIQSRKMVVCVCVCVCVVLKFKDFQELFQSNSIYGDFWQSTNAI